MFILLFLIYMNAFIVGVLVGCSDAREPGFVSRLEVIFFTVLIGYGVGKLLRIVWNKWLSRIGDWFCEPILKSKDK